MVSAKPQPSSCAQLYQIFSLRLALVSFSCSSVERSSLCRRTRSGGPWGQELSQQAAASSAAQRSKAAAKEVAQGERNCKQPNNNYYNNKHPPQRGCGRKKTRLRRTKCFSALSLRSVTEDDLNSGVSDADDDVVDELPKVRDADALAASALQMKTGRGSRTTSPSLPGGTRWCGRCSRARTTHRRRDSLSAQRHTENGIKRRNSKRQ